MSVQESDLIFYEKVEPQKITEIDCDYVAIQAVQFAVRDISQTTLLSAQDELELAWRIYRSKKRYFIEGSKSPELFKLLTEHRKEISLDSELFMTTFEMNTLDYKEYLEKRQGEGDWLLRPFDKYLEISFKIQQQGKLKGINASFKKYEAELTETVSNLLISWSELRRSGILEKVIALKLIRNEVHIDLAKLVHSNTRFALKHARKWYRNIPLEDRIQNACLGLCFAAERFDPRRNYRFNTFSLFWIRKTMLTESGKTRAIRLSADTVSILNQTKRYQKNNPSSSIAEISKGIGVSENRVTEAISRADQTRVVMLDDIYSNNFGSGKNISNEQLLDVLQLNSENDITERTLKESIDQRAMVIFLGKVLKPKEFDVIMHRAGIYSDDSKDQAEVGRAMGLSRERIRQIENDAKKKILSSDGSIEFFGEELLKIRQLPESKTTPRGRNKI